MEDARRRTRLQREAPSEDDVNALEVRQLAPPSVTSATAARLPTALFVISTVLFRIRVFYCLIKTL